MNEILFTVADVMTPSTVAIKPHDTVATAANIMASYGLAAVPVVNKGLVVGLVTPVQLLRSQPYRPVEDVMTSGSSPLHPRYRCCRRTRS